MAQKSSAPQPGQPIKLGKSNVDAISLPGIYPDTELKGFKLRVGPTGVKSYQMVGKAKGSPKTVFCTIGKHGDPWTPDMARKEAERMRLLLKQGIDPNQQRRDEVQAEQLESQKAAAEQLTKQITLGIAFEKHLEQDQKPKTIKGYRKVMNAHLKDWINKPLVEISQDEVIERFNKIFKQTPSNAAHAMRMLRAVLNTAKIVYGKQIPALQQSNPVEILNHVRPKWNTIKPREDYIPDEDLPAFFKAVNSLSSTIARDYLLVAVLTGLRHSEICTMTWTDSIDLRRKILTIVDTKNGQRHMLAMSDFLYKLFLRRWESRDSSYVFPGKSKAGCYDDPEKSIDQVVEATGVKFSSHSLRRTFATAADAVGYDLRSIQRLLNHKPNSVADRHYIQRHAEKTREPMQRITDHLLNLMQAQPETESQNVVAMDRKLAR